MAEPAQKAARSIGFTGSRYPITEEQTNVLKALLLAERTPGSLFQHGDATGADEAAHFIALGLGYTIHVWPPSWNRYRAFTQGHHNHSEKPYAVRNRSIVVSSDLLIACPADVETASSQQRSGTWQTIRLARAQGIPIRIIYGDGTITEENP